MDDRYLSVMRIITVRCSPKETDTIAKILAVVFAELSVINKRYKKLQALCDDVQKNAAKILERKPTGAASKLTILLIGMAVGYYLR